MVTEDDVDLESLQAQVDMTMSFAQSLVSSWINPNRLAQLRPSGANATHILEEELRRPPRLGVGAPIPTAPPLVHEASKLKRRLGRNGASKEGAASLQSQNSKSDDEERKGRPAKRKTKVDPFGREGSKKKIKAELEHHSPSVGDESVRSLFLQDDSTLRGPLKRNSSSEKERQQTGRIDQWSHVTEGQRLATLVASPSARMPIQTAPNANAPSCSESSREISAPVPGNITTPESSRLHNSTPMPDQAKRLGISLLNLDGPPELTVQSGNANELNHSRRRRKRRKKKTLVVGTGGNSH